MSHPVLVAVLAATLLPAREDSSSQWRTERLLLCNNARLSSRVLSPSILYVLHHWVIRAPADDGWGRRELPPPNPRLPPLPSSSSASCVLLRLWPACRQHAPRRPSVRFELLSPPSPPLKPASNKAIVTSITTAAAAGGEAAPGNRRTERKTSGSR